MFFAEFAKKSVYVATRSVNASGVTVYSAPVEYRVNVQFILPTSASADLIEVGTSVSASAYLMGDAEYLSAIKPLDKVYVDNAPPSTTDQFAYDADYTVMEVAPSCGSCRVWLKRNELVDYG